MTTAFSARTRLAQSPNSLAQRVAELRAAQVPILDLTRSNPTSVGLFDDTAWLGALAEPEGAVYQPTPLGIESARSAVAEYLGGRGTPVDPDQIVLCASTSEAYSLLFKLLANPGDTILIPRPSYPLLEHLADLECVRLAHYAIRYDGSYYIATESVRQGVSESCRAIVLVSPNNPTGSCTSDSELATLGSLGVPLISDEVFAEYPLDPSSGSLGTALCSPSTLVFCLGGLSKSAALPQLKLAWIVVGGSQPARREALDRLEIMCDTFLSVSSPVQVALPRLLETGKHRQAAVLRRVQSNYQALRERVRNTPVTLRTAQGGWTAMLQLPRLGGEDWAVRLLNRAHVLVQPGWFYDEPHDGIVVVSLLSPERELAEGVERLLSSLDSGPSG